MMPGGRSLVERLLGGALMLLAAALAVHYAVDLIVSVWVPLAAIGGVGVTSGAAVAIWRRRRGGW